MHYPPETSSIMLMARMVAVVKQVRWLLSTIWTCSLLSSFKCCRLQFSFDSVNTAIVSVMLTNMRPQHCSDAELLLNAGYVTKAKDKDYWQKLFSHFCSRAANEEEEIAHKLLGEQFRVSMSSGHTCLSCEHANVSTAPWAYPGIVIPLGWSCYSHCAVDVIIFLLHPGTAGLVTQPFQSSTLWWRPQSGKGEKLWPFKMNASLWFCVSCQTVWAILLFYSQQDYPD